MNIIWSISLDSSGYSNCGREYIKALHSIGINIIHDKTIVSQNLNGYGLSKEEIAFFNSLQNKKIDKQYVKIHHCVPDRFYIDSKAKLNIGYTVNETYDIPDRWTIMCNKMDAIFTASSFCKDVLKKSGVNVPIFVIPHCHDKKNWNKEVKPLIFENNKYENKFLFSGDMTDRKGIFELLEVWNQLPNTNNCSLTIKGYYNSFSKRDQEILKEKIRSNLSNPNKNSVFFYGDCLDTELIPRFMKSFDYIISPHKGEGFGLLPFEGIFLGVPPILTKATGVLEYANEKNSLLIDTEGYEEASKELYKVNSDYKKCKFVKINKNHLYDIIYRLIRYNNKFEIDEEEYNNFTVKFSYETIGNLIVDSIGKLL